MPAIEIGILDPLLTAMSTKDWWLGFLLGLGGRESMRAIRRFVNTLRGAKE